MWEPQGCERCWGTGYRGRAAFFELLSFDDPMRLILKTEDAFYHKLMEYAVTKKGFKPLFYYGLSLMARGITDLREIQRVVNIPE
jgi:general secretion pathway protein E